MKFNQAQTKLMHHCQRRRSAYKSRGQGEERERECVGTEVPQWGAGAKPR